MKKKICILFGGRSSEHEVSLSSSYGVLKNIDREKFDVESIGITKEGKWYLFRGDILRIKDGTWTEDRENLFEAVFDPTPKAANFLVLSNDGAVAERLKFDVVFPVLHGANGEDGTVQGLLEVAAVPFVGPTTPRAASAWIKHLRNVS
ncbi:MAG: hypothetical protein IIZ35_06915 [Clostridia bacterium]|nr:hypothetical protein [Clostridia bacterium]